MGGVDNTEYTLFAGMAQAGRIAAAKFGTVTITNTVTTSNGTTEVQGVAFKTSAAFTGTINVGPFTVGDNSSLPGTSLFAKTGI